MISRAGDTARALLHHCVLVRDFFGVFFSHLMFHIPMYDKIWRLELIILSWQLWSSILDRGVARQETLSWNVTPIAQEMIGIKCLKRMITTCDMALAFPRELVPPALTLEVPKLLQTIACLTPIPE